MSTAKKTVTICLAPQILVFHLKRFNFHAKLTNVVDYPEMLDINPYLAHRRFRNMHSLRLYAMKEIAKIQGTTRQTANHLEADGTFSMIWKYISSQGLSHSRSQRRQEIGYWRIDTPTFCFMHRVVRLQNKIRMRLQNNIGTGSETMPAPLRDLIEPGLNKISESFSQPWDYSTPKAFNSWNLMTRLRIRPKIPNIQRTSLGFQQSMPRR